jgi:hypothetical protein
MYYISNLFIGLLQNGFMMQQKNCHGEFGAVALVDCDN